MSASAEIQHTDMALLRLATLTVRKHVTSDVLACQNAFPNVPSSCMMLQPNHPALAVGRPPPSPENCQAMTGSYNSCGTTQKSACCCRLCWCLPASCCQAVLLLAAQVVSAADAQPPKAAAAKPEPKNIEEEYYTVPVRSVLGEGPHQPLSTGKILNQLGEFEIVNEGPGDATGDINATTPLFSE